MKNYSKQQIKEILKKHALWLNGEMGGERADLSYAYLSSANLRSANLRSANLSSADLSYANLSSADLRDADLRDADLRDADLRDADLSYADLSSAYLRSANLSSADLRDADLRDANLSYAENIEEIKFNHLTSFLAISCPDEGAFNAWKKAGGCIVKLRIPAKAKRNSATSRKCRASEAKVLKIYNKNGEEVDSVSSNYDRSFIYKVGKTVKVDNFDENRWNECSTGIHFFITRKEAEQW